MTSVRLEQVSKWFGDLRVLDRVTLEVREGELFFLLGPSGCGKTTCLRLIAGFYEPDEGHLYFGDRLMDHVPPYRRNTGMVFQNYALWPHKTVYQNIEYGLDLRRISREEKSRRVQRALEIVQMAEHASKSPNQLSGGQQQRVALARALVIEPDLLLLDEPLSNLDAKLRTEMRAEIKRIHREAGLTAIYVTHDQTEALSLADRLAVMRDGRIEQIGTPREVYRAPANSFVADFIGEANFLDGTVQQRGAETLLETAIGRLVSSRPAPPCQPGEAVRCCVRPESVQVGPAGEAAASPNTYPARVTQVTYLGSVEEYRLAVADTWEIKALVYNPGTEERKPGDAVRVFLPPHDVVVLTS
jgi:ABC-type Fe3+/spermidine/putrescine transport system ATPase subunit